MSVSAWSSVLSSSVAPLDTSVWPAAPGPDKLVGTARAPVAVNVHSDSAAVPPLSLVTILSSTSDGGLSLLMMVHMTVSPAPTISEEHTTEVHSQSKAGCRPQL